MAGFNSLTPEGSTDDQQRTNDAQRPHELATDGDRDNGRPNRFCAQQEARAAR